MPSRSNRRRHWRQAAAPLLVLAALAAAACAAKPVFQVNYRLPAAAAGGDGGPVYVAAVDARSDARFLTPAAARELRDFSGVFSLVVLRSEKTGDLVGAYEVLPLIRALFTQRLRAAGMTVTETPAAAAVRLEITLTDFRLDYQERTWRVQMRYEAAARAGDGTLRRQAVSGSSERVKLIGRREAEAVVGELVSDMVNRLDLGALLAGIRQ